MGQYFGTDGIRGIVNEDLTAEIALLCGNALTTIKAAPTVVICTDTRTSKDMLKSAVIAGLTMGGARVLDLGVLPTPGGAYAAKVYNADYGIVISASHNPPEYNGIKIFDRRGAKISESKKEKIEEFIFLKKHNCVPSAEIGIVQDVSEDINEKYINFLTESAGGRLDGYKVVLDCSNGAAYKVAPEVFARLGAEITVFHNLNDGALINHECGALYPQNLSSKILAYGADAGFAYDGDSDRVIALDEKGGIVNGDAIIYILAGRLKQEGKLKNNAAVGTLHTNMGMENALKSKGIGLLRSDIGDHFVAQKMKAHEIVVGGEQSGHIIIEEFLSTGDGILASVQLMRVLKAGSKTLAQLNDYYEYPQVNINIPVKSKAEVMQSELVKAEIERAERQLNGMGRILVRPSGTEPKVRVMVECAEQTIAETIGQSLKTIIENINSNI